MSITRTVLRHPWSRAPGIAVAVALVVFGASGLAPAAPAAATPPSSTTTTPVAPRTARAGVDPLGRIASLSSLVAERQRVADGAGARRDAAAAALGRARFNETVALARADQLGRAVDAAEARYQEARARAAEVAAAVYRNSGQAHSLSRLLDSRSPTDFGYRQEIAHTVGKVQIQIVQQAVENKRAATKLSEYAERQKLRYHEQVTTLQASMPEHDREVERTAGVLARARFWLSRWQSIGTGVNTPIMSRSILSPDEIATWFEGTHRHARITVTMQQLAQDYVDEGTAIGVRGDIAFAQSILETGSFYFPDGGQLTPQDNNFAGINACDSCPHGSPFPDARTGVRAQLQLLRVYADPAFSSAKLPSPPVLSGLDSHFLKGRVPTWNGLTHTWATADAYGDRIIGIYSQMLAWLTDRADI